MARLKYVAGGRNTRRRGRDLWPFCWTQRTYKEWVKSSSISNHYHSSSQTQYLCPFQFQPYNQSIIALILNSWMHLREATVLVGRAGTVASSPNYRQSPRLIWPASAYILSAYILSAYISIRPRDHLLPSITGPALSSPNYRQSPRLPILICTTCICLYF